MGEHQLSVATDSEARQRFVRALLEDVAALDRMLLSELIESGPCRIGAEQEMFLVDEAHEPSRAALEVLEDVDDPRVTTELGLFNLEANLSPLLFEGDCLSAMEAELEGVLSSIRAAAEKRGAKVLLAGILPTIDRKHLSMEYMTPKPRYAHLNQVMVDLRGREFRTLIKGVDRLEITHTNVMLEACNTSFQVHMQVAPADFARMYNLAQVASAPVLASAVNSPLLLGRRLWHETRVALMQQSLDVRGESGTERDQMNRVSFGNDWVRESVQELFRDDIARFRTLIGMEEWESSLEQLDQGRLPPLRALCIHNGTIYRWNRPCYGVKDGVAHLRIENRSLPSGPTMRDEIANAAFHFGLLRGLGDVHPDVPSAFEFEDARGNFLAAARYGLNSHFRWAGGETVEAGAWIRNELLPIARAGLESASILPEDIDTYLGVIDERVASRRTGAQWAYDSLSGMDANARTDERHRALTEAMYERQWSGQCVHQWEPARLDERTSPWNSFRTVGQIMTRDLFTVRADDLIDLAASLMDWKHIRHVPVEEEDGTLAGLISHRTLLRAMARGHTGGTTTARDIMRPDPMVVTPDTPCLEAIDIMRRKGVGCLPVVRDSSLVGIVTERDFIRISAGLLEGWLVGDDGFEPPTSSL